MSDSAWKSQEKVDDWVSGMREWLPFADETLSLMTQLLQSRGRTVNRCLDLGAGEGVIAEIVLRSFPDSEVMLVDFSDAMLEAAGSRLAEYSDRIQLVKADLSNSGWVAAIQSEMKYDAVLSAFCIHHLEHERKRELYGEAFELLGPDGVFINLDCVTVCEESTEELFQRLVTDEIFRHEEQKENGRSRDEIHQFMHEDDDEDKQGPIDDQLHWLREIGFKDVDVYFKWLEVAMFGGVK